MAQIRDPLLSVPIVQTGRMRIACLDRAATAYTMIALALRRRGAGRPPLFFTSANGEVLSRVARDRRLARIFAAADLVSADGQPMVLASRWLTRTPLPERVATTDLFHDVAARATHYGLSMYFLGATPSENARAVANVRRLYPDLRIAGARHGYFTKAEAVGVAREIGAVKPDILWLSLGVPREQEFIVRHRRHLCGVGLVKTSGGLLNFLSGSRSRAPDILQRVGLEWLYRLALEPRRLFRRYAVTNLHASLLLLVGTRSDSMS